MILSLTENDFEHLRQMTTRYQMIVYISLLKEANRNGLLNIENAMSDLTSKTHLESGVIEDAITMLLLDDHIKLHNREKNIHIIGGAPKRSAVKYS